MAIVVPKNSTAWPDSRDKEPYRVDYFDRFQGSLGTIYFEGLAEASFYADANRSWGGAFCVVESRDMVVTHEVHILTVNTDYTLAVKRFGDLATALHEYNTAKTRARKHGGRCQLRQVGVDLPLAETSHDFAVE